MVIYFYPPSFRLRYFIVIIYVYFKWTKIVTTVDGVTEFYIEKNSIKKLGNFHYYWSLANYLKLEEGDDPNEKSSITFNILNCKTSEVKTVTFTVPTSKPNFFSQNEITSLSNRHSKKFSSFGK